tara:strand:+ start:14111 stop:14701 length:591 start_codon:yes stop_codon:yes gene_type:complete
MKLIHNTKKAAMFGLDARIALAIFGALSVISGAALYSAITSANVTQRLTQIKEVEKAIEQYYLDTGSMLPFSTTIPTADLSAYALVEKPAGVTGWNGPYVSIPKHPTGDYLLNNDLRIAITFSRTDDFSTSATCLRSSPDCAVYVLYITESKYSNDYEKTLDGNDTADDIGNFRVRGSHQYFKTSIPFDKSTSPNA